MRILLLAELRNQQVVHRGAVLPLLLHEQVPGAREPVEQVVHLTLQPGRLDLLLVHPLVEEPELPLAHVPDLGQPGELRLAPAQVLAQRLGPAFGGGEPLSPQRRAPPRSARREHLGVLGDRLKDTAGEEPVVLGQERPLGPAGHRRGEGARGKGGGRRPGLLVGDPLRRRFGQELLLVDHHRVVRALGWLGGSQDPQGQHLEGGGVERHGQIAVGRPGGAGVLGQRLGRGVGGVEDDRQMGGDRVVSQLGAEREAGEVGQLSPDHAKPGAPGGDPQLRLGGAPRRPRGAPPLLKEGRKGEGKPAVGLYDEYALLGVHVWRTRRCARPDASTLSPAPPPFQHAPGRKGQAGAVVSHAVLQPPPSPGVEPQRLQGEPPTGRFEEAAPTSDSSPASLLLSRCSVSVPQ